MLFSIPMILGIVFIILKEAGKIKWDWIWVTSPIWGFCIYFFVAVVRRLIDHWVDSQRSK